MHPCSLSPSFTLRNRTTFRKCRPVKAGNSGCYLDFQNGPISLKKSLETTSLEKKKSSFTFIKKKRGISNFFPASSKQAIPF
jgi:hypothetical protein